MQKSPCKQYQNQEDLEEKKQKTKCDSMALMPKLEWVPLARGKSCGSEDQGQVKSLAQSKDAS